MTQSVGLPQGTAGLLSNGVVSLHNSFILENSLEIIVNYFIAASKEVSKHYNYFAVSFGTVFHPTTWGRCGGGQSQVGSEVLALGSYRALE